ncbi:MAG: hypothetical protein ACRCZ9_12070 [Fusobacteriaceae bacterium]
MNLYDEISYLHTYDFDIDRCKKNYNSVLGKVSCLKTIIPKAKDIDSIESIKLDIYEMWLYNLDNIVQLTRSRNDPDVRIGSLLRRCKRLERDILSLMDIQIQSRHNMCENEPLEDINE